MEIFARRIFGFRKTHISFEAILSLLLKYQYKNELLALTHTDITHLVEINKA